jgi:hypothetical protein
MSEPRRERRILTLAQRSLCTALLLSLAACTHTYRVARSSSGAGASFGLQPGSTLYVAVPVDGHFQDITYEGSGRTLASELAAALQRHGAKVVTAASAEDFAAARRSALSVPEILTARIPEILAGLRKETGNEDREVRAV